MKPYRSIIIILPLLLCLFPFASCDESDEDEETIGNWTKTTPFKGRPRSGAITFTIGDKAYVGLGYDGDDYLNDFYEYDINNGFWIAKASFPGTAREQAIAFSINGKGYVGIGYNRDLDAEELGDFWIYDPESDTWEQRSDFGGSPRYNAIGFAIGSRGYIGTGFDGDNYNSDFWEYDQGTDTWNEISSYPGEKLEEGVSFVIDNKAYLCTGRNNGLNVTDFWMYDPEGGSWSNLVPDDDETYYDEFLAAVRRYNAVAFTMNGKGYITTGTGSSGSLDNSIYEFDPASLRWTQKTSFEGSGRSMAVAFVLQDRAFVGTGVSGTKRFDDIWEFKPDEEYDETQ